MRCEAGGAAVTFSPSFLSWAGRPRVHKDAGKQRKREGPGKSMTRLQFKAFSRGGWLVATTTLKAIDSSSDILLHGRLIGFEREANINQTKLK